MFWHAQKSPTYQRRKVRASWAPFRQEEKCFDGTETQERKSRQAKKKKTVENKENESIPFLQRSSGRQTNITLSGIPLK